jgi:hypothetical protein
MGPSVSDTASRRSTRTGSRTRRSMPASAVPHRRSQQRQVIGVGCLQEPFVQGVRMRLPRIPAADIDPGIATRSIPPRSRIHCTMRWALQTCARRPTETRPARRQRRRLRHVQVHGRLGCRLLRDGPGPSASAVAASSPAPRRQLRGWCRQQPRTAILIPARAVSGRRAAGESGVSDRTIRMEMSWGLT